MEDVDKMKLFRLCKIKRNKGDIGTRGIISKIAQFLY